MPAVETEYLRVCDEMEVTQRELAASMTEVESTWASRTSDRQQVDELCSEECAVATDMEMTEQQYGNNLMAALRILGSC